MGVVITAAVIRGGSAKTTSILALAQYAAHQGLRPLCVDLDPQGTLSILLDVETEQAGAFDVLTGGDGVAPADVMQLSSQGVTVIAGSADLATLETKPGIARRLSEFLAPVRCAFDLILVDTPPHLAVTTYSALVAADRLIIPVEPDLAGMHGLDQILDVAHQVQAGVNPDMSVAGVLLTRVDLRSNINKKLCSMVESQAAALAVPVLGRIRNSAAVREAQSLRRNLFQYAGRSNAAKDYAEMFNTLMSNSTRAKGV